MQRIAFLSALCAGFFGLTTTAAAGGHDAIGKSMGGLRWGMSQSQAVAALIEKIESSYAEEIAQTRMTPRETDVRRRMKAEVADVRSGQVRFDGAPTRWDGTFLEGEFTHGNGEALVTYADGNSRNFYFFIDGKLWKWIKAFDKPTFSGKDFDDFTRFVRQRFGNGAMKRGERPNGDSVRYMELSEGSTRLRALDRIGGDHSFALVFEDKGTIGRLASLRKNRSRAGASQEERAVASSRDADTQPETRGRFGDRRSISAHEGQQQETEQQYRERQERERAQAREFQREQHARREQAQRGRSLDGLAGISDADPLAGFGQ